MFFHFLRLAALIVVATMISACESPREKLNRVNVAIASEKPLEDEIYRKMDAREISLVQGYTQLSRLSRYSGGYEENKLMNFIISAAHQADASGLSRVEFERMHQPQRDLFVAQLMSNLRSTSSGGGYIPSGTGATTLDSRPQVPSITRCNTVGGILSCSTF